MNQPAIFISCVSQEFRTIRGMVANILIHLGYLPITMEIFDTAPGDLCQMIREKIDACEGLIQIVGDSYGVESPQIDEVAGFPVSYTQFEYLYARKRKIKTWLIIAGEGCKRDRPLEELDLPDDPDHPDRIGFQQERRTRQSVYRQMREKEGHIWHPATNNDELLLKVSKLKNQLEELRARQLQWQNSVTEKLGLLTDRLVTTNSPYSDSKVVSPSTKPKGLTPPGLVRYVLDRWFPRLHRFLTIQTGTLSDPPERAELVSALTQLSASIKKDFQEKTYLPLSAKTIAAHPLASRAAKDPFVMPVHQVILLLAGRMRSGDSATAQIAALDRSSKIIRNILTATDHSRDPLILLGEPGSGKTMTLQTAAKMLADREKGRIFPRIVLYVRLGEFHVDGRVTSDDVVDYVKKLAPPAIRDRFETLAGDGRLIIYFDGMDEMSRDRYGDHTQALSTFAERSGAKTLFSCRITDFSPRFLHKRLVLLPFNRQQITEYLSRYIAAFPLTISGKAWTLRKLASHIDSGELPIETNNPFVLWLLSFFLQEKQSWPASRVELLDYYNTSNYQRKQSEIEPHEHPLLDQKTAFQEWSRMAYVITNRNRGPAIPVQALLENSNIEVTLEAIRTGKRCGVITESFEGHEYLIRFQHHRFQEYFTAAYIHDFAPSINWDDKLDAPRWQETIVNLVQMDRGQDVVGVLIASLHRMVNKSDKELQNLDPELQHLPPRFENRLADRVELTSRILRQTGSSDIRESLLEPFTRAINNLSLYGNPLSQVKVMRACQNVPEISLVDVMKQALKSPVNWVRKQAIMVLANSRGAMGTDLATEAGFDLASGQYVTRLPTYIAATLKGNSAGSWLFLCAFVACCALQMLVTLALPCAAYLYLAQDSSHRFGIPTHWLREPLSIGFTAFVTLVMAVLTVQKKPGMLWLTTPAVCLITATSIMASIDLWNVSFNLLRYFGLVLSLPVMLAIIVIGAFVPQATTLGLYLLLSVHFRKTGKLTKALFLTLWREGKFEWMLYLVGGPAVLIVISTLSWLSHYFGIAMLNESEFLGFPPIALVGMAIFYAIYLLFFYIMGAEPRSVFNLLLFYATTSLVFIVLFWGIRTLIEQEFYLYVQRAIFVVFTLAVSAIVLMGMRFAYRYLLERLRWSLSKYPAGKFTPDKWKQEIVKASAPKQVGILLRTSHQAVSLGPEEFLKLFIEIEKTITKEPALSTYWQMREQLDQALRQEREG